MKKGRRDLREKGITLVALVVTIIVLLILAGVTITMALSGSGILNRATSARDTHVQAEQNELNALSEADSEIDRLAKGVTGGNGGNGGSGGSGSGETGGNGGSGGTTKPALSIGGSAITANGTGAEALKASYGSTVTGYSAKGTVQTVLDTEGIKWQLFYDDANYVYLIASDYVPNSQLPAEGNTGFSNTDLKKASGVNASYNARFASSSSYNDYVCTAGLDYASGSGANAITSNPLTSTYLRWVASNPSSTNTNMKATAFMMDRNKWSMFANGVEGAFAIGGPTVELFIKSYNAKHDTKISTYDSGIDSNNANSNGYKVKWEADGSWGNSKIDNLDTSNATGDTAGNMWVRNTNTKAYGYWLASPASGNYDSVRHVSYGGLLNSDSAYDNASGIRPLVALPKSNIQ